MEVNLNKCSYRKKIINLSKIFIIFLITTTSYSFSNTSNLKSQYHKRSLRNVNKREMSRYTKFNLDRYYDTLKVR